MGPSPTASSARVTPRAFRRSPASSSSSVAFPGWVTMKSSPSAVHRSSSAVKLARERSQSAGSGDERLMRYESWAPATRIPCSSRASSKASAVASSTGRSAHRFGCLVKSWRVADSISRARAGAFWTPPAAETWAPSSSGEEWVMDGEKMSKGGKKCGVGGGAPA